MMQFTQPDKIKRVGRRLLAMATVCSIGLSLASWQDLAAQGVIAVPRLPADPLQLAPPSPLGPRATFTRAPLDELYTGWRESAQLVREQPHQFQQAVLFWRDYPEDANRAAKLGDPASLAVTRALIPEAELARLRAMINAGAKGSLAEFNDNVAELQGALLRAQDSLRQPVVAVFANGDVRGVATGEEADKAGTGSLGVQVVRAKYSAIGTIAIASSVDTLSSGFGAAILTPGAGTAFTSGILDVRFFTRKWWKRWHFYGSVAKTNWLQTTTVDANGGEAAVDSTVEPAVTLGFGGLLYYDLAKGELGKNPVYLSIEGGLAARWLTGDVGSDEDSRRELLGTDRRLFGGPEIGMEIGFGRVGAALHYYFFFGHDVSGLTGGQLVAAFSVSGEIFRGPLE
jgi:hypothetical protein